MKTLMKNLLSLVFCISTFVAVGQDVSNAKLRWVANQSESLKTNEQFSYDCAFVSSAGQIRWEQKNNTRVTIFSIVSTTGNWTDVSQNGRIEYVVRDGSSKGVIIFERNGTGLFITLDFSKISSLAVHNRFTVNQLATEN